MSAPFEVLRLLRHGSDPRARAAMWALAMRTRPPRPAPAIERRRERLASSTVPLGENERTVGEHTTVTSKSAPAGAFLHRLVRALRPSTALEMGTSVGLSGAYIASALSPGGKLVTLDIVPVAVQTARETFRELGLADRVEVVEGSFADTLVPTMRRLAPIDFLFVDGHHEEEATIEYFDLAQPHLSARAMVVFDDIDWSDGMRRAWARISSSDGGFAAALGSLGLWMPSTDGA